MKKRLLVLAVMIVALVSLFAFSVSAKAYGEAEIYYFDCDVDSLSTMTTDNAIFVSKRDASDIITEYSGAFAKTNGEGDAISWFKTGDYDAGNGKIFVSVKSFETLDPTYCTINSNGRYEFVSASGVTKQNIVSINFPNDAGITGYYYGGNYGFYGQTGGYIPANSELLFAYFPNTWRDTNRIVQATPVLEVYFHEDAPIDQISGYDQGQGTLNNTAFHECKSMRKVVFPKTLVKIDDGGNGYGAMYCCENLTELVIYKETPLVYVGQYAFGYCKSLTQIILPNTVKTVKDRAFEGCAKLTKLNLGASVEKLTGQSMTYISPAIQYFYVPNTITEVSGSHIFTNEGGSGGKYSVVFFAGTYDEAKALNDLLGNKNNQKFYTSDYSNMIEWNSEISDDGYVQKATNDKKYYVVYGYNKCLAFYDGHKHDTDCTTADACQNGCGVTAAKTDGHIEKETFVFENGFAFAGVYAVACQNSGCTYGTSEETSPIFVASGYSTNATTGIAGGFAIDTKLLEKFQTINGKTITFGLLVANPDHIANSFFTEDKEVNFAPDKKGALKVDIDSVEYRNLNYTVNGCANYEDLELVICMFAYTDGDVEFIQSTTSNCYVTSVEKTDATLKTVSYKSVVAVANQLDAIVPTKEN